MGRKIVVGMACFGANEETLTTALRQACKIADRVVVVYGRWLGFDAPYVKPPSILQALKAAGSITLIKADHLHTQEKQRDQFLNGIHEGDLLIEWDPDEVMLTDPYEVKMFINSLDETIGEYDGLSFHYFTPTGEFEQEVIRAYRFRKGFRHVVGPSLGVDGRIVGSPDYRIVKTHPWIKIEHRRDQGDEYRTFQQNYWRGIHES